MPTATRLLAIASVVAPASAVLTLQRKSQSLPWLNAPAYLAELPGNADFDPLGLGSSPAVLAYFREAELKHGRLAMLAAVGWPASELWDPAIAHTLGLTEKLTAKLEAPSVLNGGLDGISPAFWGGALGVATAIELYSIKLRLEVRDEPLAPGDLRFDPLGMYPVEKARRKRMDEAEVKHSRIAMMAIVGYAAAEYSLGTPVTAHSSGFFEPFWAHFFHL